jgi:hypothetical protein
VCQSSLLLSSPLLLSSFVVWWNVDWALCYCKGFTCFLLLELLAHEDRKMWCCRWTDLPGILMQNQSAADGRPFKARKQSSITPAATSFDSQTLLQQKHVCYHSLVSF